MGGLFDSLFGSKKPSSGSTAKERLQLVLVHDRSNLSPEQVAALKDEILEVIARYVDFDRENVVIDLEKNDRDSVLMAEIPIIPSAGLGRRRHTSD